VVSSNSAAAYGQAVTFTATVTSMPAGGSPAGTVYFYVDGVLAYTATLTWTPQGYQATFMSSTLAVGSHTITATYGGDANYQNSTGTVNQEIVASALPLGNAEEDAIDEDDAAAEVETFLADGGREDPADGQSGRFIVPVGSANRDEGSREFWTRQEWWSPAPEVEPSDEIAALDAAADGAILAVSPFVRESAPPIGQPHLRVEAFGLIALGVVALGAANLPATMFADLEERRRMGADLVPVAAAG
jgi:hypothetical protein